MKPMTLKAWFADQFCRYMSDGEKYEITAFCMTWMPPGARFITLLDINVKYRSYEIDELHSRFEQVAITHAHAFKERQTFYVSAVYKDVCVTDPGLFPFTVVDDEIL
jgi:hypothetical protein